MKKNELLFISLLLCTVINAQIATVTFGGLQHAAITPVNITSMGVGVFNTANPTAARLHVSNFLLNVPNNVTYNGKLFRTDGNNTFDNMWQIYTGGTQAAVSEKFRLTAQKGTANILFNATDIRGAIFFQTGFIDRLFIQNNTSGVFSGYVGINNTNPKNNLEINSNIASANTTSPLGGTGESGLRFTKLTALSTPQANPGSVFLSLNNNGDVIYVKSPSSFAGVNLCGTIPVNNVTKTIGGNNICATNITDLAPTNFVGINNTAPNDALDVSSGNIDVVTPTNSYKIGNQDFL
jgi:hypothetical protein